MVIKEMLSTLSHQFDDFRFVQRLCAIIILNDNAGH